MLWARQRWIGERKGAANHPGAQMDRSVRTETVKRPNLQLASPAGAQEIESGVCPWVSPTGPPEDALVFYDFCRAVDDIADEPGRSPERSANCSSSGKRASSRGENLPEALAQVLARHRIDPDFWSRLCGGSRWISSQFAFRLMRTCAHTAGAWRVPSA